MCVMGRLCSRHHYITCMWTTHTQTAQHDEELHLRESRLAIQERELEEQKQANLELMHKTVDLQRQNLNLKVRVCVCARVCESCG